MYQDEWIAGDTVASGNRACAERWEMIAPELPPEGVILDVGSNLGYYGLRATAASPLLSCVSLESDEGVALRQREIIRKNRATRICLLKGRLNAAAAAEWADTCDHFAGILLLSVVHWFDDPASVTASLAKMAGRVFVELPDANDGAACGQDAIALWAEDPKGWLEGLSGRSVRLLGRPARHTSNAASWLFVIEGPFQRSPSLPYRAASLNNFEHPLGRDYTLDFDGELPHLRVRGREVAWIEGANLRNLMQTGQLLWPGARVWRRDARRALASTPNHGDPGAHNMLWGANGLTMIDADDLEVGSVDGEEYLRRGIRRWRAGSVGGDYHRSTSSRLGELSLWMRRVEQRGDVASKVVRPFRIGLQRTQRLAKSFGPHRQRA